jgi:hypothetical protein
MLPSLIDDGGGQQLRRVELADGKSVEPRLLPAGVALDLRPIGIPQFDVHAVGAALAEQDGHEEGVYSAGK